MITFGRDGLCGCDQATKCPLGKTGSAARCHQSDFLNGQKMGLIDLPTGWKAEQFRAPYYCRVESDGQSAEIGFQTIHELMAYLITTEEDEKRKEQLAECWECFREDPSPEMHERFDGIGSTEKPPIHFATVPFIADCGADVPNQRTTNIRGKVTCAACNSVRADEPRMV